MKTALVALLSSVVTALVLTFIQPSHAQRDCLEEVMEAESQAVDDVLGKIRDCLKHATDLSDAQGCTEL
jgi:hypothetical protein